MASVTSRMGMTARDDDRDERDLTRPGYDDAVDFVESLLSRSVRRNGVTVQIDICGDSNGRWMREIVDAGNTAHVWDEHFETDQQALDEALLALDETPLERLGRSREEPSNEARCAHRSLSRPSGESALSGRTIHSYGRPSRWKNFHPPSARSATRSSSG